MARLDGAVAVVTGAGGGIGRALARALVAEGATAWLVGRSSESLDDTAAACRGDVHVRVSDLTNDDDVAALVRQLERDGGRLDVLVHCAGTLHHGTIAEAPLASLDDQYASNVRAFYALAQALGPLLCQGPGQVVVVNSSVVPRAGVGQFAATQHALRALTDALRQEVNREGIRVLSVYPGRTATSRQERIFAAEGREYRPEVLLQPDEIATMVVAALTLPRTAEVTDIHIRPMLKSY